MLEILLLLLDCCLKVLNYAKGNYAPCLRHQIMVMPIIGNLRLLQLLSVMFFQHIEQKHRAGNDGDEEVAFHGGVRYHAGMSEARGMGHGA